MSSKDIGIHSKGKGGHKRRFNNRSQYENLECKDREMIYSRRPSCDPIDEGITFNGKETPITLMRSDSETHEHQ